MKTLLKHAYSITEKEAEQMVNELELAVQSGMTVNINISIDAVANEDLYG